MNQLDIPYISSVHCENTFNELDDQLDQLKHQRIAHLLWSKDRYQPLVYFSIAHNGTCVFLKFIVHENHVQTIYSNINDPVYKDTCVEFFISIGNDTNYYNLEFNANGTCAIGYGSNKFDRKDLPTDVIASISTQSKLWNLNSDFVYCWHLTLIIPATVFIHHQSINLNGLESRLNFYKCGDDLPLPHFIAWNNIESEQPNFHLPEFFGRAVFLRGG